MQFVAPIGQSLPPALVFHNPICSGVASLLASRCPASIPRLIVTVLIWVAINGVVAAWPWPHVLVEVRERLPSLTHTNPPPAVVGKMFVFGVIAPSPHCRPDSVFRDFICHAVGDAVLPSDLREQTTAAIGVSTNKIAQRYCRLISAVALAAPHRTLACCCWKSLDCDKSPEPLLSQILPVMRRLSGQSLAALASATCKSLPKGVAAVNLFRSAGTSTKPKRKPAPARLRGFSSMLNYGPSSNTCSGPIFHVASLYGRQ